MRRELALLEELATNAGLLGPSVESLTGRLAAVNARLWDIEDAIRIRERERDFGSEFIALARSIYANNDERAAVKRAINSLFNSALVEEKSYG